MYYKFSKEKYPVIGNAEFKDFKKFKEWLESPDGKKWSANNWSRSRNKMFDDNWDDSIHIGFYDYQEKLPYINVALSIYENGDVSDIEEDIKYLHTIKQKFDILYTEVKFSVISASHPYVIPNDFLDICIFNNYDEIPLSQLKALAGTEQIPGIMPIKDSDVSVNTIKLSVDKKRAALEDARKEIEDIEKKEQQELERIKLELEQHYKDMMAPILKRQEELEILRKQLENQLFVLDTEIYAIRCYFGETIKHTEVRSLPSVLNQKWKI